jgi:trimethylamine-N-oxide reductase (cytochrome c)
MSISSFGFSVRRWGMSQVLRISAGHYPAFAAHMKLFDGVAQIRLQDESQWRWFAFAQGQMTTGRGIHAQPTMSLIFRDLETANSFLDPWVDQAEFVHAAKNFKAVVKGDEAGLAWFLQLLNLIKTVGLTRGTTMPDGSTRYTTVTNGGPLFVYVREGQILRTTPIAFDETDAPSWEMQARGKSFKPMRKATVAPHSLVMRSTVY